MAIKTNGNIIPELNHLKNLNFLLITLGKVLYISYLKLNKIKKGVNDRFIFLNKFTNQFKKINIVKDGFYLLPNFLF